MKLYIPEIGDEITLSKDWVFELYPERRNDTLGAHLGYYVFSYSFWINEKKVPKDKSTYNIDYPKREDFTKKNFFGQDVQDYEAYTKACNEARDTNSDYIQYLINQKKWRKDCELIKKETIEVTIPKGSVLKIDRIYIRKGSKDYSSVTFWVAGLTKKKLRFWAKLNDVNKIEFK